MELLSTDYKKGFLDGKKKIIEREIENKCLNCGSDIRSKIYKKEIHLHFCEECRGKMIDNIYKKLTKTI
jgi:Zn finger protein HypA/HybF involved in hydrogenase expression